MRQLYEAFRALCVWGRLSESCQARPRGEDIHRTCIGLTSTVPSSSPLPCSEHYASCWNSLCCSTLGDSCFRKAGKQYAQRRPTSSVKCGSSEQWSCPGEPKWSWPPASPHLSQNSASQLWPTPCCADADESLHTFLFFAAFGFAFIWFACRNDIKKTATSTARSPSAGSSMSHSKVNSERAQNATADETASSFEMRPNTCSCEECSSHSQPMQHASNESLVPPSVLQGDLSQNILTELDVELTGRSVRGHANRRWVVELQQSAVLSKKEGVIGELRLDHVALITSDKSLHVGVVEVQGGCSTTDMSRANEEEAFTKSSGREKRRSSKGVLSSARNL